ncbi:hypothetical protein [Aliarcobacter butzleri]|uniref:hypothetical protein n=1 Tax=Aliarcobacter butzleri TaxID=28197 RepID=UPI00125FA27F|nr:hypothetical protein [Aliarcobacter butzleri]
MKEKDFSKIELKDLGYSNFEYENMSENEKLGIRKKMTKNDIDYAKDCINLKIYQSNLLYDKFKKGFNPSDVILLSLYDRYYVYAMYHHLSLFFRRNNLVKGEYRKELYAQNGYEESYRLNQKLTLLFDRIMHLISKIKYYKIGVIDTNLDKAEQIKSLNNSIKYIINYLDKEPKSNKEAKNVLTIFTSFNVFEILEQIKKSNLNYINSDSTRYEIFEQVILAPIKLKKYIDLNKYKDKSYSFEDLERYLKNSGLWDENESKKIEYMKMNHNEFFKIQKNQIKSYCVTVFAEFFSLNLFDLKKIYTFFYSNAITSSTKFLQNFYNHMPIREEGTYLMVEEFLPYMHEDFKEIFYEISPKNIPERDIIEYLYPEISILNQYFESDILNQISFVTSEDDIPEDGLVFKI